VPTLHERASSWHRVSGSVGESIKRSAHGGLHAGPSTLSRVHGVVRYTASVEWHISRWLSSDMLGDDQIAAHPVAAHCAAWAAAFPVT